MAPTKAPWAEHDEDELEELEGEDTMGSLGAYVCCGSARGYQLTRVQSFLQ
jgi:hypothetical protein